MDVFLDVYDIYMYILYVYIYNYSHNVIVIHVYIYIINTNLVDNELMSPTARLTPGWVRCYKFTPLNKRTHLLTASNLD